LPAREARALPMQDVSLRLAKRLQKKPALTTSRLL
jgi:hypothetical protein